MINRRIGVFAFAALSAVAFGSNATHAQKRYGQGVTDTEILMGQTMPYTGPVSGSGIGIGAADAAILKLFNDRGGVNGRKFRLISLDDGYLPPKTLELTRRLIEQDRVALLNGSLGTGPNSAIAAYLNERKIPHLMFSTGADKFYNTSEYPMMVPYLPRYSYQAAVFAKWILREKPDAKITFLYQNDDFGTNFLDGLKATLGPKASNVVKALSFEVRDPTVDSQVISLADTKADVLFVASVPQRPASQAIRKAAELGWKPIIILPFTTNDVQSVLRPGGIENSVGAISTAIFKDPNDPALENDPEVKEWREWVDKYVPQVDKRANALTFQYSRGWMLKSIIERAGDDLTPENILKVARTMPKAAYPLFIPGLTVEGTPEYKTQQVVRFDGTRWVPIGTPITAGQ